MKKNIFFGAKTLAVVAMTSLMFTSCDEENFVVTPSDPSEPVQPTELPNASAVVSATTLDLENNKEVDATYNMTMPYSVTPGADGSIAAQTLELTSSAEGYYTVSKDVNIPAVAKGQMVYLPITFYTSLTASDVTVSEPTYAPDEVIGLIHEEEQAPSFTAGKTNDLEVMVPTGYKLKDYDKVIADIKALTYADSRAMSEEEIMERVVTALTNLANSLKEFKYNKTIVTAYIPENIAGVKASLDIHGHDAVITLSTIQEGKKWSVEAEIEEVEYTLIGLTYTDQDGHSHAGHAGHAVHGNGGNNAGGGAAGK